MLGRWAVLSRGGGRESRLWDVGWGDTVPKGYWITWYQAPVEPATIDFDSVADAIAAYLEGLP